jgi:nickel transport protein
MQTSNAPISLIVMILSSIFFCQTAWAHDLWMTVDPYVLHKAESPSLAVFSAHRFPAGADDYLAADRLDQVFLISPNGAKMTASAKADGLFSPHVPMKETGTYLAVALPRDGFATKTTEGYRRGKTKKDVENVIECRYSRKIAIAVFTMGRPGGEAFSRPLGQAMEIVPLKDPATLKTGDVLPVKVIVEGKPARTFLYGTYAGFSESPTTFAYTTRTDKEGVAAIKMIHSGVWVLIAKQEEAYPDTATCDKQAWAASLTFEIH